MEKKECNGKNFNFFKSICSVKPENTHIRMEVPRPSGKSRETETVKKTIFQFFRGITKYISPTRISFLAFAPGPFFICISQCAKKLNILLSF